MHRIPALLEGALPTKQYLTIPHFSVGWMRRMPLSNYHIYPDQKGQCRLAFLLQQRTHLQREVGCLAEVVIVHAEGACRQVVQEPGVSQDTLQADPLGRLCNQQAHEQVLAGVTGRHLRGQAVNCMLELVGVKLVLDVEWVAPIYLQ